MRILLLSPVKNIFLYELCSRLLKKPEFEIYILDIFNGVFINVREHDIRYYKIPKRPNRILRNIRAISNVIKYRRYFLKQRLFFDVANIHYVDSRYVFFIKFLKKRAKKLIASVYGADYYFYKKYHFTLKYILKRCDRITFANPKMESAFHNDFKGFVGKTTDIHFGLSSLENLSKFNKSNQLEFKAKLGFPSNKKAVMIGYSSSPFHQHLEVIEALNRLKPDLKEQIYLVVPMTYGGYTEQIRKVNQSLDKAGFEFKIFEKYLSEEEIVALRYATDIMLNLPVYDQLSGTFQENLFVGNIIIAGDWLPYSTFDELGADYIKVKSITEVTDALSNIIKTKPNINIEQNRKIIWEFSNWGSCLMNWVSIYTERNSN